MNSITRFVILVAFALGQVVNSVQADQYQCLTASDAQRAKALLQEKKFAIEFCSNCSASEASIKRIDIGQVDIVKSNCGHELKISGKLVRGIKPPVFEGACNEELTVYNPSTKLKLNYTKTHDLAYLYVWEPEAKIFVTVAEALGLDTSNICIKHLKLSK